MRLDIRKDTGDVILIDIWVEPSMLEGLKPIKDKVLKAQSNGSPGAALAQMYFVDDNKIFIRAKFIDANVAARVADALEDLRDTERGAVR